MAAGQNPWQQGGSKNRVEPTAAHQLDSLLAGQESAMDTHKALIPRDRPREEKKRVGAFMSSAAADLDVPA